MSTVDQVIVTGATGFVGQHLVRELLARQRSVVVMVRSPESVQQFDWAREVQVVRMDMTNKATEFSPRAGAALAHLAWSGLPNYNSLFHIEKNLPDSYRFVKLMVERGVSDVLVAGTCFEYGHVNGPIRSDCLTNPATPYALAKDSLRRQLEFLAEETRFCLQWARLFYMYGSGQSQNSLLPLLDSAIERGDRCFNMSGGEQLRDYLPICSVVRQLCDILIAGQAGKFNICSGKPVSVRRLVEDRIEEKGSNIRVNFGYYSYPKHEPMAFWGVKDSF